MDAADAATWLIELPWLLVVLVAVALAVLLLGFVAVVLDVILVILLLLGGVAARVLFRRPWTIEAEADSGERFTRQVVGWTASDRVRHEMADGLRHGQLPAKPLP